MGRQLPFTGFSTTRRHFLLAAGSGAAVTAIGSLVGNTSLGDTAAAASLAQEPHLSWTSSSSAWNAGSMGGNGHQAVWGIISSLDITHRTALLNAPFATTSQPPLRLRFPDEALVWYETLTLLHEVSDGDRMVAEGRPADTYFEVHNLSPLYDSLTVTVHSVTSGRIETDAGPFVQTTYPLPDQAIMLEAGTKAHLTYRYDNRTNVRLILNARTV